MGAVEAALQDTPVKDIQLLSPEECREVRKAVYDAKDQWVHRTRKPPVPLYTLGTNSYMDALKQGYPCLLYTSPSPRD